MAIHDLTNELMAHLEYMIGIEIMPYIEADMRKMGITHGTPPQTPTIKVVKGDTTVDGFLPIIRIQSAGMSSAWLAARTRKDTYRFTIDVDLRIQKKETKDSFIMGISNSIRNRIMEYKNLAREIYNTSTTYYNAWADDTVLGIKGDGGIRTCRFPWWCEVCNTYVDQLP